jgi:hypothetical protein
MSGAMKLISYRGGVVRFAIPDAWLEEYEEEGGATFYDDRPDAGILRLNVITAQEPPNAAMRSGTDRLLAIFKKSPRTPTASLRVLDNGNVLYAYTDQAFEDGEDLLMYFWEIANRIDENHIRLAIFSFAILASQDANMQTTQQIAMLHQELSRAEFTKCLGV